MSGSPAWVMSTQGAAHAVIPVISAGSNKIDCATCACEVGTLPESIRHGLNVLLWIEQLVWDTTCVATPLLLKHVFFLSVSLRAKGLVERELGLCPKSSPLLSHWDLNSSQVEILSGLLFSHRALE